MKCDNGCRIGYGCEVHDNTGDYWHRQFFAERARAERAENELASAPDLDDLNYQLRAERERAERAEAEVEQWKRRYHESQDNWTLIDMGNHALADRLAEALRGSIAHSTKDCHGGCGSHIALAAYEEARR